jgi:hypothetical protein
LPQQINKQRPQKGKLDWVASISVRVGLSGPARRNEDLFECLIKKRFGSLKKLSYLYQRLVMMVEANSNKTDCVTLKTLVSYI